ncbi:MAG: efflux RND transporter permease subunit [Armatimonadetes bacterium]|nr:efflux RND transporter permease subunit [Armatimonadota bacterium]MDE2205611.1 efflux RND transporter permease subunit [Armatimonadota bacterium]
MQWLANICVRRPVFSMVLILSLVVTGAFSYLRLGIDLFPKVDFPVVTVTVQEDGASPEEIETDVVDKIEDSVNTVSGIDELSSTSYDGVGVVVVTFQLDKDIDTAVQDVRDKVNSALPNLPLDVKQPVVDKVDLDAIPVMEIALSSKGSIRDTTEYADKVLRRQIESISGVGQVNLLGGRKRQINLWIDPNRLAAYGLSPVDVENALAAQNIQVPGGEVDEGVRELTLRTHGRVETPQQFADIAIAEKDGATIHVGDVARVQDGMEEATTSASLDGVPTVLMTIRKQSGLNTVATVDAVKARLADLKAALPPGYKITTVQDQSLNIKASTSAVQEHLIVGSILAALVVLIFLWNWRTTIISAIAIPTSVISTFGLMYIEGFTLNSLTLLALTLSVGIVIDDAIVVLENIFRFVEEKGMNPFEAAIEGTREIGLAVLATTLSLIAIFLPVAFMSGIVGRFMNSFGVTMAFAVFISLIVSFSLTPSLASRWIRPAPRQAREPAPEGMPIGMADGAARHGSKQSGLFRPIDAVYTWLLRWSMHHRWVIVLAAIAALGSTLVVIGPIPKNFLPEDDQSQFQIFARAPEGATLAATARMAEAIAADVRKLPGVAYTVMSIGDSSQRTVNLASIYVKLVDIDKRPNLTQEDVMIRARTQIMPMFGNLRVSVGPVQTISTGAPAAAVTYAIGGPDLNKLTQYSQQVLQQLRKVPGVVDADTSLITGNPELGVHIDRRRAADLGVSVADVANTLRLAVGGAKVTDYYENGEQYEVHERADLQYRNSPQVIGNLTVPSQSGSPVKLQQVVTFTYDTGPSQITRLNRQRDVMITCNVLPGYSQQNVNNALAAIVQNLHMPPGYTFGPQGTSREIVKALINFVLAFALAIIFMYLILAAQFESWVHPITILLALPLTLPFALIAIYITGQSINIFSVLGILVLFGVVKKNGILQVDHMNQLRARGMNRMDAIIQANRDRLRPILMTTSAFVIGMVPLVLSNGAGASTNKNIGYTVIGGQTLSLLLTLLATPVFYSLFDDVGQIVNRLVGRAPAPVQHTDDPA